MAESERRLEKRVVDAVREAMTVEGWSCAVPDEHLYDRPLNAPFILSAKLEPDPGENGEIAIEPLLWVACPEADRVLWALGADDGGAVAAVETQPGAVSISLPEDIAGAVAELMKRVREEARAQEPLGESVEAFAAGMRADGEARSEVPTVLPVILAVAGRRADARRALEGSLHERNDEAFEELARRMSDWLDGKGLPPRPDVPGTTIGPLDVLEAAARSRAGERRALAALQALGPGAGPRARRDVLRAALEREAMSRDLAWIERHANPRPTTLGWRREIAGLGRVGRTVARLFRGTMPRGAARPLPSYKTAGWVEVDVDDAALPVLARAVDVAAMQTVAGAYVAVAVSAGSPEEPLRVSIDGTEIGRLARTAATETLLRGTPATGEVLLLDHPPRALLQVELPAPA